MYSNLAIFDGSSVRRYCESRSMPSTSIIGLRPIMVTEWVRGSTYRAGIGCCISSWNMSAECSTSIFDGVMIRALSRYDIELWTTFKLRSTIGSDSSVKVLLPSTTICLSTLLRPIADICTIASQGITGITKYPSALLTPPVINDESAGLYIRMVANSTGCPDIFLIIPLNFGRSSCMASTKMFLPDVRMLTG